MSTATPSADRDPDPGSRGRRLHGADRRAGVGRDARLGQRPRSSSCMRSQAATRGLGYTYADIATARLIEDTARRRRPRCSTPPPRWRTGRRWFTRSATSAVPGSARWRSRRSTSRCGISRRGCSELPLVHAARRRSHDRVPIYGSGGFTSYPTQRLHAAARRAGSAQGITARQDEGRRDPDRDPARVRHAREAIGPQAEAVRRRQRRATRASRRWRSPSASSTSADVSWFEEPVCSDDLDGLALVRDHVPHGMAVAAGEYGYDLAYFARMLIAGAVDVPPGRRHPLRRDHRAAAGRRALRRPLRDRCRCTAARARTCIRRCALSPLLHLEYFHDHVAHRADACSTACLEPRDGALDPDLAGPATASSSSAPTRSGMPPELPLTRSAGRAPAARAPRGARAGRRTSAADACSARSPRSRR